MLNVEWTGLEEEANCEDGWDVLHCAMLAWGFLNLLCMSKSPLSQPRLARKGLKLHRFALFFHCVREVFVVLVCQLGVVFYKCNSFRELSMVFVEIL